MQTAEKSPPSALDFLAQFQLAVESLKKKGKKLSPTQALTHVIGEYNKTVSNKRWRVETVKRNVVMNLARCPPFVHTILAEHYDEHKHTASGRI